MVSGETRRNVTYDGFLSLITKRMAIRDERYGQAMFNILTLCRPLIAEKLRATALDPFYKDDPADIPHETWILVASEWGNEVYGVTEVTPHDLTDPFGLGHNDSINNAESFGRNKGEQ
jgi:hypothetical protein